MDTRKDTGVTTRIKRGIALYRERDMEIVQDGDTYRVPGSNGESYTVSLTHERCSCPDHGKRGGTCKHLALVTLYAAKAAGREAAARTLGEITEIADSLPAPYPVAV